MNIAFFLTPRQDVATLYDDNTLRKGLDVMRQSTYSAMPVTTRDNIYVGSVSVRDFLYYLIEDIDENGDVEMRNAGKARVQQIVKKGSYPPVNITATLEELLDRIRVKGIHTAFVTLHVGLGTFRPVKEDNIEDHLMHSEYYEVTPEAAATVNAAKASGGRIVSVGTTSCRVLETASDETGALRPGSGWTDIYIYPGYRFKVLDALITNFHLPESTLLMLVSALAGREHVLEAYRHAITERYRFFSFGDAMYIH